MHKNLVLITSPFQLINFNEYSYKFKIEKSFIIALYYNTTTLNQIFELADFFKIKIQRVFRINKLLYLKLYMFSLKNKKFSNIILGQYFSNPLTFITNIIQSDKVIYVDDGFQTLMIDEKSNINKNTKIIHLCFFKTIKKHNNYFFSIFDLRFNSGKYIHNDYSFVKTLVKGKKNSTHIYFIGQPFIELGILEIDEYMVILRNIISKHNLPFIYLAHRREKSENLNKIKSLGIDLIVPILPIEVFLIKNSDYPKAIIGVSTTALLTVSLMFEGIKISYFYVEKLNKIKKFNEIYNYLDKYKVKCFQNS